MVQRVYVNEVLKFLIGKAIDGDTTTFREIDSKVIQPMTTFVGNRKDIEEPSIEEVEKLYETLDAVTELCIKRGLPMLTALVMSNGKEYPGEGFWRKLGFAIENKSTAMTILKNQCFNWFNGYTIGDADYKMRLDLKKKAIETYEAVPDPDCQDHGSQYPEGPLKTEFQRFLKKLKKDASGINPNVLLDLWLATYVQFSEITISGENRKEHVEYMVYTYDTNKIVDFKKRYTYTKQFSVPIGDDFEVVGNFAKKLPYRDFHIDAQVNGIKVVGLLIDDDLYNVSENPKGFDFIEGLVGDRLVLKLDTGPIKMNNETEDVRFGYGNYKFREDRLLINVENKSSIKMPGIALIEVEAFMPPVDYMSI